MGVGVLTKADWDWKSLMLGVVAGTVGLVSDQVSKEPQAVESGWYSVVFVNLKPPWNILRKPYSNVKPVWNWCVGNDVQA